MCGSVQHGRRMTQMKRRAGGRAGKSGPGRARRRAGERAPSSSAPVNKPQDPSQLCGLLCAPKMQRNHAVMAPRAGRATATHVLCCAARASARSSSKSSLARCSYTVTLPSAGPR